MTEQERQIFIDSKWMKICDISADYFDIKEEFEINTLTKKVRNVVTHNTLSWFDLGGSIGKRTTVNKKSNNKNTDICNTKICKDIRKLGLV